jgi:ABC-type nickel/cobalt efflux system permease component RcnA
MDRMNGLMTFGVILVFAGILGFAIPVFTTQKTDTVARIGDLKLQNTEDTSHHIPQLLSGGVLVLGLILIGTSLYQKR